MDVLVTNNPGYRIHGDGITSAIPAASASEAASKRFSEWQPAKAKHRRGFPDENLLRGASMLEFIPAFAGLALP